MIEAVLAERLDLAGARTLAKVQGRHRRLPAALGAGVFVVWFVLLPLSLLGPWEPRPQPTVLLALAVALHVAVLVAAARSLRACGFSGSDRTAALAPLVFFPPAGAHAATLTRDAYAGFDPLAVAAALLEPSAFRQFARQEVRRLQLDAQEPLLPAEALRRLLGQTGQQLEELLAAPEPSDSTAAAYCPRCDAQYRQGFSICSDCGGILRTF